MALTKVNSINIILFYFILLKASSKSSSHIPGFFFQSNQKIGSQVAIN